MPLALRRRYVGRGWFGFVEAGSQEASQSGDLQRGVCRTLAGPARRAPKTASWRNQLAFGIVIRRVRRVDAVDAVLVVGSVICDRSSTPVGEAASKPRSCGTPPRVTSLASPAGTPLAVTGEYQAWRHSPRDSGTQRHPRSQRVRPSISALPTRSFAVSARARNFFTSRSISIECSARPRRRRAQSLERLDALDPTDARRRTAPAAPGCPASTRTTSSCSMRYPQRALGPSRAAAMGVHCSGRLGRFLLRILDEGGSLASKACLAWPPARRRSALGPASPPVMRSGIGTALPATMGRPGCRSRGSSRVASDGMFSGLDRVRHMVKCCTICDGDGLPALAGTWRRQSRWPAVKILGRLDDVGMPGSTCSGLLASGSSSHDIDQGVPRRGLPSTPRR